jgi:hypothetical protein
MVTLYAAEIDAVLVRRLWPRTLLSDSQEQEPQDEKEAPHDGQRAA